MDDEYLAGYSYDEWRNLEKEFFEDYEKSTKYNKSFSELISEVLEGETYMSFAEKTHLSENMLYRLKNQVDEKDPPQRSTLISVSVGYHLDLMMTQALLYSLGLGFNRFSKRDYAYTFLLTRCRGKSIDECNDILEKLGIEQKYWLGSYAKRPRTK
ncbi:hypothetical protein [Mediterraneibacter gnavus]|uniref:hypothetical protein n=1 Tax=Mediterraneibacter gnavus TaxID=33038 RepID=UPI00232CDF21|nr:hypothetical protein [Mediterraneibacter gnavus]MDB8711790.1 hypothetical protein [Mediterraneibacter gnavus]MDB8714765.1 hypothetical protein [Mediterraneibacter gnavus]